MYAIRSRHREGLYVQICKFGDDTYKVGPLGVISIRTTVPTFEDAKIVLNSWDRNLKHRFCDFKEEGRVPKHDILVDLFDEYEIVEIT